MKGRTAKQLAAYRAYLQRGNVHGNATRKANAAAKRLADRLLPLKHNG